MKDEYDFSKSNRFYNAYIWFASIDELLVKYSVKKISARLEDSEFFLDPLMYHMYPDLAGNPLEREIQQHRGIISYYTPDLMKALGWLRRKRKELIEKHKTLLKSLETETKITIESEEYKI